MPTAEGRELGLGDGGLCRQLAKPVRSLGRVFVPLQWKARKEIRRVEEMRMEGGGAEDGGSERLRREGECRARAQEIRATLAAPLSHPQYQKTVI
jgi:hypothetical protein